MKQNNSNISHKVSRTNLQPKSNNVVHIILTNKRVDGRGCQKRQVVGFVFPFLRSTVIRSFATVSLSEFCHFFIFIFPFKIRILSIVFNNRLQIDEGCVQYLMSTLTSNKLVDGVNTRVVWVDRSKRMGCNTFGIFS